jgi:hypothetical protein
MLELEKWGQRRTFLLVIVAHQIASSAEECYEACMMVRDKKRVKKLVEFPPGQEWYRLYKQHRRVMTVVKAKMFGGMRSEKYLAELEELREDAQRLSCMSKREIKAEFRDVTAMDLVRELNTSAKNIRRLYREHLETIKKEIKGEYVRGGNPGEVLKCPEVLFFLRVAVPCWLEYGKPVQKLLREARQGDLDAMVDLLRLDKGAIEDRMIRQHYLDAANKGKSAIVERLTNAMAGGPLGGLTAQKVKVLLGALVYKLAKRMHGPVAEVFQKLKAVGIRYRERPRRTTAPDVRKLFNAVAKDYRKEDRDVDLRELSDHGFYTALIRELDFWPELKSHKSS